MSAFSHIPVMLEECMQGLNVHKGGVYFDGTIGGANHSYEILKRSSPDGRLIATDLDDSAIEAASQKLKEFTGRFSIHKSNFKLFESVLEEEKTDGLDGVLLDLGVSSHQLDTEERGFSYMKKDAPLDMRMDSSNPLNAEIILNTWSQQEIAKILRIYGEEKFASQIAAEVAARRQKNPLKTCGDFVEAVEAAVPKKFQQNGPVARKSFQAVRIAVNGELDGLYDCIVGLTRKLNAGGRIAVITFHSLEDRIVKQAFTWLEKDCICPKTLPVCVCGKKQEIQIITKKPVVASVQEMAANPRSKSAKLRVAQKI